MENGKASFNNKRRMFDINIFKSGMRRGDKIKNKGKLHLATLASVSVILFLILVSFTTLVATAKNTLPATAYAYVPNEKSNTVTIFNITTDTIIANVSVGKDPCGVAISPDGTKVYVTNEESKNVSVIDSSTYNVINVSVEMYPLGIAITPDGTKLYVANYYSQSVSVIDTSNYTVTNVTVGPHPIEVAITPDGSTVYVANSGDATVSVINTATNAPIDKVNVKNDPYGVAVTPDGTQVYVTSESSNTRFI